MRLINVDKLPFTEPQNSDYKYGWNDALWAVKEMPTIDAVPVVRCRECWAYGRDSELAKAEYLNPDEYCGLMRCEFPPDGYCSYGRIREDGDA